ncbi:MAG: phage tail tube protein [Tagaea sp.]|nr:phage tail tube protein [Tagaea sp.]
MANPNQRTGQVFIALDGKQLESLPGAKLRGIGVKRNPVVGHKVYGYTEEIQTPEIECDIAHGAAVSLDALRKLDNTTATFECDTGPTWVLANAWVAEIGDLADGKVMLKINAKTATERQSA